MNPSNNAGAEGSRISHRLPTVTASQALKSESSAVSRPLSFGLNAFDGAIQDVGFALQDSTGGLRRGQVAEIVGPPGSGKTALSLQACATTLHDGGKVMWIGMLPRSTGGLALQNLRLTGLDCSHQVAASRLDAIRHSRKLRDSDSDRKAATAAPPESAEDERLAHWTMPTLSHLLCLLLHSASTFPPPQTDLVIVDDLATLVDATYARALDERAITSNKKGVDMKKWLQDRRPFAIAEIAASLSRLAAVHNVAVLVTNYCSTRIRDASAVLIPAIAGREWENAMAVRISLFRDWAEYKPGSQGSQQRRGCLSARFADVLKTPGRATAEAKCIAFEIGEGGITELPEIQPAIASRSSDAGSQDEHSRKRSHSEFSHGHADGSSDSDYGWTEDDVQLAAEGLVDDACLSGEAD